MLIGIFSKLGSNGGSEHRVAEMANSIVRYSGHRCIVLCESRINDEVRRRIRPGVQIALDVFGSTGASLDLLTSVDSLLVVNSDSYSFSKLDYWEGRTDRHSYSVDVSRIPQMVFLYNFVISPSQHLHTVASKCKDVRIVCANRRFFDEVTQKHKFDKIRHLPRTVLDSPIDPATVSTVRSPSERIRIGKHSMPYGYKFNEQHAELIHRVNAKHGDRIMWDFMGVPRARAAEIACIPNVTVRREFSIPVRRYLEDIDVFLFFIGWKRNEPWSRAVAEALAAGIPVIATDRAGNRDQIVDGNNGYLCSDLDQMYVRLCRLIEDPELARRMGRNGAIYSRRYAPGSVIGQYLDFIG